MDVKKMLIIASFLFVLSAYGTGAVNDFDWFIFLSDCGWIWHWNRIQYIPVYIAEVAPAPVRGKFVSLNQLTIVLGILMAQLANWQIGEYYAADSTTLSAESVEWAWRWMFGESWCLQGCFLFLHL